MEKLYKEVQKIRAISDSAWQDLRQVSTVQTLLKGDFVLKEGAVSSGIYFVSSGLVRIYYHKHDKDISEWFAFDQEFCFSIISYFKQVPSVLILQCLEDSEVITISRKGLDELRNSNFEIANLAYDLVSGSLILSQERMASLQFETALQRYESLMKQHPTMLQRVPLHFIASYLGVSSETLSRIRGQIH